MSVSIFSTFISYPDTQIKAGSITNDQISAGAAIVDTKLATISTASKVSGAALTSVNSIPAGAGVIPSANLPSMGSLELMHYVAGNTTATSATDLVTHTFSAGDFTADDSFLVVMISNSSANYLQNALRINDGTNTATTGDISYGGQTSQICYYFGCQSNKAITDLVVGGFSMGTGNAVNALSSNLNATMIDNWITTGFTMILRGNQVTSGTGYYRLWIYKLKGA